MHFMIVLVIVVPSLFCIDLNYPFQHYIPEKKVLTNSVDSDEMA